MLSLIDTYLHLFTQEHWKYFAHSLMMCVHFERCIFATELMMKFGMECNTKYLIWATSTKATSDEINYEPLETYGDTIIKLASTWLIYDQLKTIDVGEYEISECKNVFLTNMELFRVAAGLGIRRYIWTKDIELWEFILPQTDWNKKLKKKKNHYFI